jgi:hypothetical protein
MPAARRRDNQRAAGWGFEAVKFYLYKMRDEWTLQLAGGGVWDAWTFESWEKAQSFVKEMLAHPLRMYRRDDNTGCLRPYSIVE